MNWLIHELERNIFHRSLLMVSIYGLLMRLYCPFSVESLVDHLFLERGEVYYVTKVKGHREHQLIFLINGVYFPYHLFKIVGR